MHFVLRCKCKFIPVFIFLAFSLSLFFALAKSYNMAQFAIVQAVKMDCPLCFDMTPSLRFCLVCHAPLHKECPQHHKYKGEPGVIPKTCGAIGERAQVIIVWMRAPRVENVFHPRRVGVTRVRP